MWHVRGGRNRRRPSQGGCVFDQGLPRGGERQGADRRQLSSVVCISKWPAQRHTVASRRSGRLHEIRDAEPRAIHTTKRTANMRSFSSPRETNPKPSRTLRGERGSGLPAPESDAAKVRTYSLREERLCETFCNGDTTRGVSTRRVTCERLLRRTYVPSESPLLDNAHADTSQI